ncbi:hypothetical protein FJW06_07095 [Mesorhizobium sp. B4-1-3]|uniref:hypothetical protein n=1 Tax=Mesorhizobium sp. B4-1-3 TaxID=2589889 RepID=UPI00112B1B01|nr:hypothetical protein [Mesorhizobium sp. B4-1-3]TPI15167.1 hypothetical protein FJW06_07095 [Mesorhizobium sp. B4-1-3]
MAAAKGLLVKVHGDGAGLAMRGRPPRIGGIEAEAGTLTSNRGHGTGTLSLLAGNKLDGTSPHWPGFTDFVGGAARGPGGLWVEVDLA